MRTKKLRTYVNERGDTEVTLAFSEKKKDELCDFCSMLNPPYRVYPCEDFQHPMSPVHWSRGEWNACQKCATFIDADDLKGLVERCALLLSFEVGDFQIEAMEAFQGEFLKRRFRSAPQEPKSGQPESPGSHSSSHSQGGGSPDEDPSK